jgi:membrane fusion protein (multidrug efflux system)
MAATAIALLLVATWLVWAFTARVTQYEVSDLARLEVTGAAYPIEANASGRLVSSRLVLGQEVQRGEILLELESREEQLDAARERVHFAGLQPELAALRSQIHSEDEGRAADRTVLSYATGNAQAQYRQAQAQQRLAEEEARRAESLRASGLISEADAQRAKAEAEGKRAGAESLREAAGRLQPELRVRDHERDVRLKQLAEEIAKLEAEAAVSAETSRRLDYDLRRRSIRAPIAGKLSEYAPILPGAHIMEGQRLGVIVPAHSLELIAQFEPPAAFGKIVPGQRATVRLQGFPWAQFGTLPARVLSVAGEIRDGKVRVELAIAGSTPSRIPFQHGMPGSVEVEVGRVSPAVLLLRSASGMIGAH